MTLREEVLKDAVLNEDDYFSRREVVKIIDEFAEEILKPIHDRMNYYKGWVEKLDDPEKKKKAENIYTMLASTEKMVNDVWSNYLRENRF